MKRYPREDAIQEVVCQALQHLVTGNAENQLRAHRAGALPLVLAALTRHRQSE